MQCRQTPEVEVLVEGLTGGDQNNNFSIRVLSEKGRAVFANRCLLHYNLHVNIIIHTLCSPSHIGDYVTPISRLLVRASSREIFQINGACLAVWPPETPPSKSGREAH